MKFPENLTKFIETQNWIFAKTYAETYPHEYIVQEKVDENLFLELAKFIDENGYEEYFYSKKQIYFDFEGFILAYGKYYQPLCNCGHLSY